MCKNVVKILAIAVSSEYRHKGIGKSMLSIISSKVTNENLVAETDKETLLFYLKCGFKITYIFDYKGTKRYKCVKYIKNKKPNIFVKK